MRIGIFGGTGPAGTALAARLASVGYEVVVGSRSKDKAVDVCAEVCGRWSRHDLPLVAGVNADAAQADLVVVATPWESAAPTAQLYADALAGKVVVSMANALVRVGREFQPLMLPRGSVAAHIQAVLPRSSVVAAFHHLPAKELADIDEPVRSDVLICSDETS